MSLDEYRGEAYLFRKWMQEVQDEIARGERKGATVLHKRSNPAKVCIGWFERRVLKGEVAKLLRIVRRRSA